MTAEEREDMLEYFGAIVNVTSLNYGRNPNRMRALAGQIARNAITKLRKPKVVEDAHDAGCHSDCG
jgi:hypothetical protein